MAVDFFVHRALGCETPGGIAWPVRPKDGVGIPTNARVLAALIKWKCSARVVHNGYDVINESGDALQIPFGASLEHWEQAAECVGTYRNG